MKVHLGYEIASGAAVEIPLGHLVVSGQTQLSGKTTTLEAIVSRSGLRAIAFVTKRGEQSFAGARDLRPFYREPKSTAMWQYVSEVLQAKLGEKMKFERSWIMRVSKGAKDLWDVQRNVQRALKKEKLRELDRSVYEQLEAYFELVLPELEQIDDRPRVIGDGANVMRLEHLSTETQMLCIASTLERVYHEEQGVITIIPEAWEMVPQGRNTPVKAAAATMFRKGAGLKNFVWFDSQDLAGVDKQALKQVSVWILGVQREENEARRMIEHLDVGGPKPKLADVRTLGLGEFFVSFGRELKKVYVQPAWAQPETSRRIAIGDLSVYAARFPPRSRWTLSGRARHESACGGGIGMSEPASRDEYLDRLKANAVITGFGLDTTMHMPCPFCAAPDFLVYGIFAAESALAKGAACGECGRSAKAIFLQEGPGEVVQTGGPDAPEWLTPKMRRVA